MFEELLYVRANGKKRFCRFYHLYGTDVTDREAIAILESLTPLKKNSVILFIDNF